MEIACGGVSGSGTSSICEALCITAHLATQTLNTAAPPKAPNATFTTLTNPTTLQTAAFVLLGIEPMRVQ